MEKKFRNYTASMRASASDACFAAAVCLIMTGAISVVSVILLTGVLLLGVSLIIFVRENLCRKNTMAA